VSTHVLVRVGVGVEETQVDIAFENLQFSFNLQKLIVSKTSLKAILKFNFHSSPLEII
jgi:hypothetical protein